jgi:hypothetical protein
MAVSVEIDLIDGLDLLAYVSFYEPYVVSAAASIAGSSAGAVLADAPVGHADGRWSGSSGFTAAGTVPNEAAASFSGSAEFATVSGPIAAGAGHFVGDATFQPRNSSSTNTEDEQLGRKVRVPKDPRSTKISGSGRRTSWR